MPVGGQERGVRWRGRPDEPTHGRSRNAKNYSRWNRLPIRSDETVALNDR